MIRSLSNRPREQPLEASVSLADHPPLIHAKGAALGRPRTGELGYLLGLVGIINLGLAIRALHVASGGGFPLNDGGMFFAMIEDVKRASFALPEYTSYTAATSPSPIRPSAFILPLFYRRPLAGERLTFYDFCPCWPAARRSAPFTCLPGASCLTARRRYSRRSSSPSLRAPSTGKSSAVA